LIDIEDPQLWPSKGQFEHAFQVPVEFEPEPKRDQPKRRKSEGSTAVKETKKRRNTMEAEVPAKRVKSTLSPKDQLLRLRMKLQMFLQQKEAYVEQDFKSASEYLSQTETLSMDIDLFRV
jgi:hypothetical protein